MRLPLAFVLAAFAGSAVAHDGELHASPGKTPQQVAADPGGAAPPALPFPVRLGGAFELIDQTGAARSEAEPEGRAQLLFFGYANCQAICSVALPLMGEIVDLAAARGAEVVPVMITVDPRRDTVDTLAAPLAVHHPAFVGLTGDEEALAHVYDLFSIENTLVFEDPEQGPVYAHGSHIYLLDGRGQVLTLIPPILGPEHAAKIVASYVSGT